MKRFVLFAGYQYYPTGGWHDFRATADSYEELKALATEQERWDWWHVIDLETGERYGG